jgi:hypothetical protein
MTALEHDELPNTRSLHALVVINPSAHRRGGKATSDYTKSGLIMTAQNLTRN